MATHFPTNGGPLELGGRSVMVSSIANFSPLNTHDSTFFPLGAAGRDIFLLSVGPMKRLPPGTTVRPPWSLRTQPRKNAGH